MKDDLLFHARNVLSCVAVSLVLFFRDFTDLIPPLPVPTNPYYVAALYTDGGIDLRRYYCAYWHASGGCGNGTYEDWFIGWKPR